MTKQDDIKYISEQIKDTVHSIENSHFQLMMGYLNPHDAGIDDYEKDVYNYTNESLRRRIKALYYLILAYLEIKEMVIFLEIFKEKFDKEIDNTEEILKCVTYHEYEEPELLIINQFKIFLAPFKFFDYQQIKEDETIKLISILESTESILKKINVPINNEADIYKQVKWVLRLYYPSIPAAKSNFDKQFKTYKPDILIPELKTAIEYKYIKNESDNIDDFIDQIRTDAVNYTDDYKYDNFVAVIYIQDVSVFPRESIKMSWDQKKFPRNWKLVIVFGSPTQKF